MDRFHKIILESEDIRVRIYYITLSVASIALTISLIADIFQGFNRPVLILVGVGVVFLIALWFLSVYLHIENLGKHLLIYSFNLVLFPEIFIYSGGITCGLLLAFLISLLIIGILLEGKSRIIAYLISIVSMECTIYYSYAYQDKIKFLNYKDSIIDYCVTLPVVSLTIIYLVGLMLKAYNDERTKTQELNQRLQELSVKDELSGLYNRRELFRRLNSIYRSESGSQIPASKQDCYIAMFDIDNFKRLNDTYGHQFGDKVLSTIAHVLMESSTEDDGEIAARYGGEEFVVIIRAASVHDALERVDQIRKDIESISWDNIPDLVVTVSGGLSSCESFDNVDLVIKDADEHLYKAKHEGKNQIQV
jgi:diguanylate cyclase (GGDEF)-like protein